MERRVLLLWTCCCAAQQRGVSLGTQSACLIVLAQIMHAFSVAPFDQNLSIDGKMLSDDTATLGSLGVIPESVILLKADEPIADYAAMDDVMQVCMPEEGFKGTGLLGH